MADMKRNQQNSQLETFERNITNKFKLTSIEAERVSNVLQAVLRERAQRDELRKKLPPRELRKARGFMNYLKANYPISDAMAFHISERLADTFYPVKSV